MGVHVNFELSGERGEYVESLTGRNAGYSDVEEYLRDLIARDVERREQEF